MAVYLMRMAGFRAAEVAQALHYSAPAISSVYTTMIRWLDGNEALRSAAEAIRARIRKSEQTARQETKTERWQRLFRDSQYRAWYNKVAMHEASRVVRPLEPLVFKPNYVATSHPPPSLISVDEWVEWLFMNCSESVLFGGVTVQLVQRFREAIPLDRSVLPLYEQDDRIVLLKTRQWGAKNPSKHCLVFETQEDVEYFFAGYDDESEPFMKGW